MITVESTPGWAIGPSSTVRTAGRPAVRSVRAAQRMSSAIAQFDGTDDVDAALVRVAGVLVRAMRTRVLLPLAGTGR